MQLLLETYGLCPTSDSPPRGPALEMEPTKCLASKTNKTYAQNTRGVGNGHSSPKGLVHRTRGLTDVAARTQPKCRSLRCAQIRVKGTHLQKEERKPVGLSPETETTGERRGGSKLQSRTPTLPASRLPGTPLSHNPPTSQHHWVRTFPCCSRTDRADWGVRVPHPRSGPPSLHDSCHSSRLSSRVAASTRACRLRGSGAAVRGDVH